MPGRNKCSLFDEDIDIWDDNAVKFAMAFRYMPQLDTLVPRIH
jgi:2,5-furandicarboxylate decarboxylase 1